MNTYTMEVVTQVLTIIADNEEQAEAKYNAYFTFGEDCPCGEEDCDCVDDQEDVYHNTTSNEKNLEIPVEVIEKALWDLQYEAEEAKTFETPTQADYEEFLDRDFESDQFYAGAIWALRMILEKKEAK